MPGHLGLIVKGTRFCNLRCSYCHDWRTGPGQTMPFPVLARMVAAALQDPEHDAVSFFWHGGEPLVLGREWYEKALYVQARLRRPRQRIVNALQTNGTLVDAAWARFFRAHDIRVSLSLDGPPDLHDKHRVYASGRPSFRDVTRGWRFSATTVCPSACSWWSTSPRSLSAPTASSTSSSSWTSSASASSPRRRRTSRTRRRGRRRRTTSTPRG